MKTMLVNPFYTKAALPAHYRVAGQLTTKRSPFAGNPRKRNPSLPAASPLVIMNPRSPRRRARSKPRRRMANPMLPMMNPMQVPRRSRRRRMGNPFNLNVIVDAALRGTLTGGGAYLLNKLLISSIGVDRATGTDTPNGLLMRQGVRIVAAMAGAYFMPSAWGSAWVGANFYPFAFELDNWWRSRSSASALPGAGAAPVSASLEAELEAALNGY